jgi:uncharacterized repeat protein (TIGR01451 family)
MRKLACLIAMSTLLGGFLTGCGEGPTTIQVSLGFGLDQTSSVAPGESVAFVIVVTDTGTAGTAGITVTADLPADFRYIQTGDVNQGTAVRTTPVDPQGNSQQPTWGVWELSGHKDNVIIPFDALAAGSPGPYTMTATASGSSTGSTTSNGLDLTLTSAPQLGADVSVSPSVASPGEDVTYSVGVYNTGTGRANLVSVTITLPPVFIFNGGVQISGNAGRSGGTDPIYGTEIPYFDGFEIPAATSAGPGKLTISFQAQVLSFAGAEGTYPVGVQVLGDAGLERVELPDSAPVQVT